MVSSRDAVEYRAMLLNYATLGGIALEAGAELATGFSARSVALVSIGFYRIIELVAGAAERWRFRADLTESWRQAVGRITGRLSGLWSLAFAVSVAFGGVRSLLLRDRPGRSVTGVIILTLVLVVTSLVARAKRCVATAPGSSTRGAEDGHASLSAFLPGVALVGVVLNVAFGWWWADPVAALAMVPIIAEQGSERFWRSTMDSGRA
jgi:hypothetical protein